MSFLSRATFSVLFSALVVGSAAAQIRDYSPSKPYEAFLRNDARGSYIDLRVPIAPLEAEITDSINRSGASGNVTYQVRRAAFENVTPGSQALHFHLELSGRIHDIAQNFDCDIKLGFMIPRRFALDVRVLDTGTSAQCRTSSWISVVHTLGPIIAALLRGAMKEKLIDKHTPDFAKFQREDPALLTLIQDAHVQGWYCPMLGHPGICLRVGWTPKAALQRYFAQLVQAAPIAAGPIDPARLVGKLNAFTASAKLKELPGTSFKYPTKVEFGVEEDEDTALFAGLLCYAGEPLGCETLRRSQGPDGRFWRSPGRIGVPSNQFSGDQFNGVMLYIATTRDAVALSRYLQAIATHREPIPTPSIVLDYVYKTCENDGKVHSCALGGVEWFLLNAAARALGRESDVPAEMRDPAAKYGYSLDTTVWQAGFAPRGFYLHLTGVQIAILRTLGVSDPRIERAAAMLASRDPENPFFLFLHLGADQKVLEQIEQKCSIDSTQPSFHQWSWERSSAERDSSGDAPWKYSMMWDCAFMYRLLGATALLMPGKSAAQANGN